MSNYKFIVNPAYGQYSDFVGCLPRRFDTDGETVYEGRNMVKVFVEKGQKLVVKRYKRPMLHQRFDYTFIRKSKARRAYDYALRFLQLGVDTPAPVACVEEYKFGLFRTGFFVSTYCGDPDLRVLRDNPEKQLIEAFARFIVRLHEMGIMHGDLNLSNVLYRKDSDAPLGFHFTMIDTNRSHIITTPTQRQCLRNMVRISHDRVLSELIISCYAELRGWDVTETVEKVKRMLDAFEKRRRVKRRLKR